MLSSVVIWGGAYSWVRCVNGSKLPYSLGNALILFVVSSHSSTTTTYLSCFSDKELFPHILSSFLSIDSIHTSIYRTVSIWTCPLFYEYYHFRTPGNGHSNLSTYLQWFLKLNKPVQNLPLQLCTGKFLFAYLQLCFKIHACFVSSFFLSKDSILLFYIPKELTSMWVFLRD